MITTDDIVSAPVITISATSDMALLHPPALTCTVYSPPSSMVNAFPVAPVIATPSLNHWFPCEVLELRTGDSVLMPDSVINGFKGLMQNVRSTGSAASYSELPCCAALIVTGPEAEIATVLSDLINIFSDVD